MKLRVLRETEMKEMNGKEVRPSTKKQNKNNVIPHRRTYFIFHDYL